VVTVLLAACGGGGASTPSAASSTASAASSTASATSSTPSATSSTPSAGTNVRLAAPFTILDGGAVTPAVVTVRAQIPLELVVDSRDGRGHRARLDTPASPPIVVPAHGRAEQLLPALPAGSYRLIVDGRPRAALRVRAG
jgi:hypothetical protein